MSTAAVGTASPLARAFAANSGKWWIESYKGLPVNLANTLDGVLPVDKSPGMTSHDVVAVVRQRLGTQKVGHCGTLDPFATGLLLIVVGRGTKIQDLLMSEDKEYVGTMRLGQITSTQDRDGEILERRNYSQVTDAKLQAAFAKF